MNCPQCQALLVEIPTSQTPQLDVCPGAHGLWLDAAEINFFVEDYRAVTAVVASGPRAAGSVAVQTKTAACPRCGGLLDQETVSDAPLMACRACHGLWLPRGSLTRLNGAYRGGGATIRLNEAAFYARAAAKRAAPRPAGSRRSRSSPTTAQPQGLWFWALLAGFALLVAGVILSKGIRETVAAARWVHQPDELLWYLVLGVVSGVGLFFYGFKLNREKRLIESIPTSAIRSLAVGLVEVAGTAQPDGQPLQAPFSETPCVFFSYKVQEQQGSGKNTRWETIAKGTSEEPFYIRDQTGAVLVVPFDAELIVADDRTYRNNWLGTLPPEAIAGLNRLGISTTTWLGSKTIRCTEAFIQPGDTVYVLGTAQDNPAGSAGFENADRLYIGSNRDEPFIIADRSEKDLLANLRWKVLALLYGGPALIVACLFVILTRYMTTGPSPF